GGGLSLLALELDLALAEIGLHPGQLAEKVVIPERAAELAVGDGFQPHVLLPPDGVGDLAVLDRLQLIGRDLVLLALGAGFLQRGRAQQAADVIGAERGLGALHGSSSLLSCPARGTAPSGAPQMRDPGWPPPQHAN